MSASGNTQGGPGAEAQGRRPLLLYIEDNPVHIKLIEYMVAQMGSLDFIGAETPTLGLELARDRQPDVILLDLHLPEMDGYAVVDRLRADARTRDIPVVAISAGLMREDLERGPREGIVRLISKPFDVPELKGILAGLLAKGRR